MKTVKGVYRQPFSHPSPRGPVQKLLGESLVIKAGTEDGEVKRRWIR